MSTQKKKRTSSQRKRRSSHFALNAQDANKCSNCSKPIRLHHACTACGFYKGKEVVKIKSKIDKKSKDKK